jgi:hypothetical protein
MPLARSWIPLLLMMSVTSVHGQSSPMVVELFTSQGCSSCPPADRYLGTLTGKPDVIALAYHVTYWDSLGWRDQFAMRQSDERQQAYAARLHRPVGTPQFVIDGAVDALGTDAQAVSKTRANRSEGPAVTLAIDAQTVSIGIGAGPGAPADVEVIAYLRHAVSAIGRGENSGRTLEEFNIVRSMHTVGRWQGAPSSYTVPVASLPQDATDVVALVQAPGQAAIMAAAVLPLPSR